MIPTRIAGIPCLVRPTHIHVQRPDRGADNPDDFFGYEEVDYEVLDRTGRPANWLAKKLTTDDDARIVREILTNSLA